MSRVVVVGSSNTDMTISVPSLPAPGQTVLGGHFRTGHGGKGANQAVAARRAGAQVVFVTAVGPDQLGRSAVDHYQDERIDTSYIKIVEGHSSGVALILVDEHGENSIAVAPGANEQLSPHDIDQLPESLFTASNVLLVSLEIPVATAKRALDRGRRNQMTTILNPAPAPLLSDANTRSLLESAMFITPNRVEARSLSGNQDEPVSDTDWLESARKLETFGPRFVVITLGAEGCLFFDDRLQRIKAPRVTAVDTVGAGDAFNGALAAVLLEKSRSIRDSLAWATAAAALAVTQPGAQSSLPYRKSIDEFWLSLGPQNDSISL